MPRFREALWVTLMVAVLSALVCHRDRRRLPPSASIRHATARLRKAFLTVNNLPMVNPEIVTGISLMLLFVVHLSGQPALLRTGLY